MVVRRLRLTTELGLSARSNNMHKPASRRVCAVCYIKSDRLWGGQFSSGALVAGIEYEQLQAVLVTEPVLVSHAGPLFSVVREDVGLLGDGEVRT
ncbi:MAG: hypothetical protein JWN64_360 [Parcubacteria group bacterium]|nr:hypothetical protein [Parcubacteria group bacterium]